jgi:signal transduction histidine kinase
VSETPSPVRAATTPSKEPAVGPSASASPGDDAIVRDFQRVLSAAVQRLQAVTGSENVTAWALRPDGTPYVAAACFDGGPPAEPIRAAFDRMSALPGTSDLREPRHSSDLRRLAVRLCCWAAAPVRSAEGALLSVLLLGTGGSGAASPARALAALEAERRRLESPLAGALALGRLRCLDAEVQHLDRLATLGNLLSEVAHEVRNPLVSIKTFVELLPERRDDPEFLTRFYDVASEEMRRVERLLDLVLDQAGPDRGESEASCLDGTGAILAVAELVRHLAKKRDVRLDVGTSERLPPIALTSDALRQLVLNLTLNAIEAAGRGGAVQLRANPEAGGVTIAIGDTGPGVPLAERERVFEPFVSGRGTRGGGLGLAISRRLAEQSGGNVRIGDSALGGAEFRVWLPVCA